MDKETSLRIYAAMDAAGKRVWSETAVRIPLTFEEYERSRMERRGKTIEKRRRDTGDRAKNVLEK